MKNINKKDSIIKLRELTTKYDSDHRKHRQTKKKNNATEFLNMKN